MIQNSIPSSQLDINPAIELLWVHIHSKQDIIVGSFYQPPGSSISVLKELEISIGDVRKTFPTAKILLAGDFNMPGIDWLNNILIESYASVACRRKLLSIAELFHLEQIVLTPTHGPNILDLCFTSHPDNILSSVCMPGLSDHDAVLIRFCSQIHFPKQLSKKVYVYKKANWNEIRWNLIIRNLRYLL